MRDDSFITTYKSTLRYIAVMVTVIFIILVCEGIAKWT